ncbi:SMI1/KNR4 family protein [Streptomyces clavifer]|uniref:SMI1/KNR4 family protein n=1 Tax=Streptomyces clavifer TaxID=68188 RepID=UPI0033AED49B
MTQVDIAAFDHEWARFESWLSVHSPADRAALRGPADPEGIARLESRLGFALHPELRRLLELHDGAALSSSEPGPHPLGTGAFLPLGHCLSGLDDIAMMHEILVHVGADIIEADVFDDEALAVNLYLCVPIALPNDGGVAFVDHRPGSSYGHVYEMGLGSGDIDGTLWATGPAELFRVLAESLETGSPFLYYRPSTYVHESGQHRVTWEIEV